MDPNPQLRVMLRLWRERIEVPTSGQRVVSGPVMGVRMSKSIFPVLAALIVLIAVSVSTPAAGFQDGRRRVSWRRFRRRVPRRRLWRVAGRRLRRLARRLRLGRAGLGLRWLGLLR